MKRNSVQKLIKLTDYLNNLPNFTPPSVINYWVDFQNPDYHFLNFNEATIIISSIYFCEDSKLSKWPAVKLCHEFIKSINLSKVGKTIYCHDTLDATEFHDGIGGDIDSFYWISACWKLVWLSTEQCQWLIRDEESQCAGAWLWYDLCCNEWEACMKRVCHHWVSVFVTTLVVSSICRMCPIHSDAVSGDLSDQCNSTLIRKQIEKRS